MEEHFMTTDQMDAAPRIMVCGTPMEQSVLVHGFCAIFALALHDKLGCGIRKLSDNYGLVHAYGIIEKPSLGKLYLDARGWTKYEDTLLEDFHELCDIPEDESFAGMPEYGYGYGRVDDLDAGGIEEFRKERRESLTEDEYEDLYAQSASLIEEWDFSSASCLKTA